MPSYLSKLHEKYGYKVILVLGLLLAFSAMVLSLIAVKAEEKLVIIEKSIGPNGVLEPIWSFYEVPYSTVTNGSYIEFTSQCPIDVPVIFIDRAGNSYNITVSPNKVERYNVTDLSTIMWVKPLNCTISSKLHVVTLERKYMFLAIPSLALFLVSTVLLILAVVERTISS